MQKKLHKFELAALANLCPENAEEAKSLIPRYLMIPCHAIICAERVVEKLPGYVFIYCKG